MELEKAEGIIEAILFTMGESVEIDRLVAVLELDKRKVEECLENLEKRYTSQNSGISLLRLEDSVQLCTKGELYEYLIKIAKTPKRMVLSDTVLETLSIIAYKQPVTRMDIERVRGVSCDFAVNKLLEYDLIKELGRKDAPGHPLLFGTTEQFLRCFGVSSLGELPEISALQMEEFKAQAEEEAVSSVKEGKGVSGDEEILVGI